MRQLTWAKSDSKLRFMVTINTFTATPNGVVIAGSETFISLKTPLEIDADNVTSDRAYNKAHDSLRCTSIVYAQMVTPEQLDACGFGENNELETLTDEPAT